MTFDAYLRFRDDFITLAPDKYPPEYIDAQVWAGFWRCWGNDDAAILAEIRIYPTGLREVHGIGAAGNPAAIIELITQAEEWGRESGCTLASIESRPAWARLLPEYETDQIRIVKGL